MVCSISKKGKAYFDLNLSNLQIYLVKAMQEQQKLIDVQRQQLNSKDLILTSLQNQINALSTQIQQLQNPK